MDLVKSISDYEGVNLEKFHKATLFRSDAMLLGVNCLEAGQIQKAHDHADQDKFYYVTAGNGRFQLGTDFIDATVGEVIIAPAGVVHGVENVGNGRLTLLVGITPAP